ncbi:uncharacterized protein LOC131245449 [Magnolia sinica]|uniref:uncharacterized protein LOC131245449 n=1 Tax=Magnolia sinica TaxID=86752 RepID=UPI002657F114|nr:uncharacterized protein LOC131245449 [Magnolia sinica]XP_058100911.1 uncharacterized protein LOC131245449 [Magnolia sinica]XP_058100912.1 uncharacterized protein LOC131245449 [Magnolia sinica]XP_058100913.1 uncharacterized protein LOC131245449 [Magnolia sinica]XP_058100914.1 uncharacterized protein LOC131245449 [Magnolia sinica]XP_058100915.1 uncharacterized protein LOC131245449 [Magnolia sinica]XP_058100916.1 uncharacterized protein LOC131245449 [Magnolia sinica]XP_058100917.1 uncharacte
MAIIKRTLRAHHFCKILKLQNPSRSLSHSHSSLFLLGHLDSQVFSSLPSISRTISSSAAFSQEAVDITEERIEETDLIYLEKNGRKSDAVESASESQNAGKSIKKQKRSEKKKKNTNRKPLDSSASLEIRELKEKIRNLERDVEILKANRSSHPKTEKKDGFGTDRPKSNGLYSLFAKPSISEKKYAPPREKKLSDTVESRSLEKVPKELSPEMLSFVNCLHEEGYLRNASFLKEGQLDLECFSSSYSQSFLKSTAERFGCDHQDIAKWLSGGDLKKVALFGCPTVERKTIFAAKGLRTFFRIEEDIVCRPCKLKSSCKFVNHRVVKKENVNLVDTLRLLTVYASDLLPQQLIVTDDLKLSINKLLKEVVNLSK